MGVEVEFSEITWEGLLASLDNGTVDLVLNQVGVTDEREEKYDFTDPYLYSYIALITTGDNTNRLLGICTRKENFPQRIQ